MAVRELGHRFVGMDLDPAYVRIAERRIAGWLEQHTTSTESRAATTSFDRLFDMEDSTQ